MKICSFDGCGRKHSAKGFCNGHYTQFIEGRKLKQLHLKFGTSTVEQYIESNIENNDYCWVWRRLNKYGYGVGTWNKKHIKAHRLAYETYVGEIPTGMTVHHKCANRACCNPEHLELATHRANTAEMFERRALKARIAELEARVTELEAKYERE